mgnify:CR=1 FL=1
MKRTIRIIVSVGIAALALTAAIAADQAQERQRDQVLQRTQERAGKREIIPGSELMTAAEREDYRRRYAAARTDAERSKVRSDHVKAMDERAGLRGLKLADPVPPGSGKK